MLAGFFTENDSTRRLIAVGFAFAAYGGFAFLQGIYEEKSRQRAEYEEHLRRLAATHEEQEENTHEEKEEKQSKENEESEFDKEEGLFELDTLTELLNVPNEVFSLNKPLATTLASWSQEDLTVLRYRVRNFMENPSLKDSQAALRNLERRLSRIITVESDDEIDPKKFKAALLRQYNLKDKS